MDKIIIEQPWGGLGDNLQFSTIPEIAHQLGIEVWVSNYNTYRNKETKQLVWDLNPFIKGYTNERGNIKGLKNYSTWAIKENNCISNWEIKILGKKFNDLPFLYYKPKIIENMKNKILMDINSISLPIDFEDIILKTPDAILLNNKRPQRKSIYTKNIFEWIDFITSCKKFICQYSGGNIVMACYNKTCEVYLSTDPSAWQFKTNNYIKI